MARTGTVHRLRVDVSDVDRGVYEAIDIRVSQHPSETTRRVLARAIAYALSLAPNIEMAKEGLCEEGEPAIAVRDAIGIECWIDVDVPSPERLKKATIAARRVIVFATERAEAVVERARELTRGERVQVIPLDSAFLDALALRVAGAGGRFSLTRSGAHLYATCDGVTLDAPVVPLSGAPT